MENTLDKIIVWLNDVIENKKQITPSAWLEIASKMNVLLGNETDELAELHQKISQMKLDLIEGGATATKAKIAIESTDAYKAYLKLKAKISRVEELIRLAKIMARMKDNEYRNSGFNN
jgi:hypothetical protein